MHYTQILSIFNYLRGVLRIRKKSFAILVALIVIGIVGVLSIGSMVTAGEPQQLVRTYTSGDVETLIRLSGNDVIVSVIGGDDADNISSIYVYYKNGKDSQVPRNPGNTYNNVIVDEPIVFKDMAKGLKGSNSIVVEAVFDDPSKSTKIIGVGYCVI